MSNTKKIIRAVTVPQSLDFCREAMMEMRDRGYEMVAVSSPGEELERLRDEDGFHCIAIPMKRRISLLRDLMSLWSLVRTFRKEKPYMVHSMTPKAGLLCMLAAWMTRVPKRVHTFTGLVWPTATGVSRRILMFTDWLTCGCATHVIPEGKGVMDDLQRHITRKPMKVLGYGNVRGIDLEYWKRTNASSELVGNLRKGNVFTFIFVGRIVRDKGINELVESFSRLARKYDVRLMLIGQFEENLDPISDVTKTEIEANRAIMYAGLQYGRDLLAYYAASDCFVFPSYREGFPNTVLEAGAMGLPSIVTDINGSREIIENGKNGLIIPSKDTGALYEAMRWIIKNKAAREEMAKEARPMIGSRFERGFVQKCLLEFYDEIINDSSPSPERNTGK